MQLESPNFLANNSKQHMSTGRAIQVAAIHATVGILTGAAIEALLPSFTDDSSVASQAFEIAVQVGLNGAVISSLSSFLQQGDSTHGIVFSFALWQAQPELRSRVVEVASKVKMQASLALQQTVPRSAKVQTAS